MSTVIIGFLMLGIPGYLLFFWVLPLCSGDWRTPLIEKLIFIGTLHFLIFWIGIATYLMVK